MIIICRIKMQLAMRYKTWGGKRKNAGRKPANGKPGVQHAKRPSLNGREPLHVTLKVGRQIPNLRAQAPMRALRSAFAAGKERVGFRLIHFSVQLDHVHMVIEAQDRAALSRGVKGLSIRMARGINRALGRRGRVFGDRYHARVLGTPREVRNVLSYVLLNAQKHGVAAREKISGLDPCSSADVFDGWANGAPRGAESSAELVVAPWTWLLRVGWRRHGLLAPLEKIFGATSRASRARR